MLSVFFCLAVAIHDVDGPIHCATGERIRLQGIGGTEMDGTCRPGQPCVPGDPRQQRRVMAALMGAEIDHEDASVNGQAWFVRPVELTCEVTGKSHGRVTAWCRDEEEQDLSCAAIYERIAVRWPRYDRGGRLKVCGQGKENRRDEPE